MKNDIVEQIFQNAPKIFEKEIRKNPDFHFGFKQWDDIQTDILEHAWIKSNTFDRSKPIKPWLRKVIENQIKNQKRNCAHRNRIEARIFSSNKDVHNAIAYLNNDPPAARINAEIKEYITNVFIKIWKNLSFREKKMAILYFEKKISCAIIANRYNMSRRHAHQIVRIIKDRVLKELKTRKIHIRHEI